MAGDCLLDPSQPANGNFREPLANRFPHVYVPSYEAPRGRTSVLICRGFINSRVGFGPIRRSSIAAC